MDGKTEKGLLRIATGLLLLVVIYSGFASLLNSQIGKKQQEAESYIENTNKQIQLANADNEKIKTKTNEYTTMINEL